jgi:cation-transporting P-type ATPase D
MRLLEPVLSNPRICKVVHGGGNDVVWLQRDFGLFLVNCFDTEKACQARTLKGWQDDFEISACCGAAALLLRCCWRLLL